MSAWRRRLILALIVAWVVFAELTIVLAAMVGGS